MKIFYSESVADYSLYTFNYCIYAISEHKDDIEKIYQGGFLPYTGRCDIKTPTFYLARSLRMNLSLMKETSENRRTMRAMEDLNPTFEHVPLSKFPFDNPEFLKFCVAYADVRYKNGSMSQERLKYLFSLSLITDITICRQGKAGDIIGYVLLCTHGKGVHYWFSFLNVELMEHAPIGKFLMWNAIKEAQQAGNEFMYLGTCYGSHSLYKVRDHKGLEFYDGAGWNRDVQKLKKLCKSDDKKKADTFKTLELPQQFIDKL